MADEIVFVQPLHDDDDRAFGLVVQARIERSVEPLVDGGAAALGHRVDGLQRIVDDDEIGAAPGQDAADRGRQPKPARRRDEFSQGRAVRDETRREQRAIPGRRHDCAAVARELVGKLLAVGDVDDRGVRIVAEQPGRQRDRGGERFQMARRNGDDQPLCAAVANRLQLGRHHLDVRGRLKRRRGVQLHETAHHEDVEIRSQRGAKFPHRHSGGRAVHGRSVRRRISTAITAASASLVNSGSVRFGLAS